MTKFVLQNRHKITQLIAIFLLLKNCSPSAVTLVVNDDHIHIQLMDPSHICLCESILSFDWFDNAADIATPAAAMTTRSFTFCTQMFHTILKSIHAEQTLEIDLDDDADVFRISFLYITPSKTNINKYFSLTLIEQEQDIVQVPATEYNVEFTIGAKTIADIFKQMAVFSPNINIKCDVESVALKSSKEDAIGGGDMRVQISTQDIDEFAIDEDYELDLDFSLTHLMKYCMTTDLTETVMMHICGGNAPMKIKYVLDADAAEETAIVQFFLTSKIVDDESDMAA